MLKLKWEAELEQKDRMGNVPKDWKYQELETIAYLDKSIKPTSNSNKVGFIAMECIATDSYFPSFELTDLENIRSGKEVLPNSVLLAKITPSFEHGKMCIVPNITSNRWFATTEVFSLNPKNGHDVKFIFYLLKHPCLREILENSMSGTSGRQRVQTSALKNLRVPYPASSEQSRIGTVLSWFDDLIENKKKQNEILEKTAIAIFKSWFVDFEPFRNAELADSAFGKMPKSWEIGKLSDVCEIIMGQSPPSEYYNREGEGSAFIQGKGQFGRYTPNTDVFCSGTGKRAKPRDILLTVRAPIGELNIADAEYIIGRGLASLRSETWVFVYLYLLSNKELLKASERGTTFDAIIKPELESFPLVKPPQDILEKFKVITEPLFSKILLNQKQIWVLSKVRDVLLPLLVFGKLRVEEI